MTFTLKIKLGNDAMQTGADIAESLRTVAERLDGSHGYHKPTRGDGHKIMDLNGNAVGQWEVK